MGTITGLEKRKSADKKEFNLLTLQGSIEVAISKATGKPYLTAKKTSIPCTFDDALAKGLIGTTLPGEIERIMVGCIFFSVVLRRFFPDFKLSRTPENQQC